MNPITNMKNLNKMNDRELEMGLTGTKNSWHAQYSDSAWIFIGGLPYDLSEGDIICIFSQYGEIVHINLVRDLQTGKSKGFAFICYEDQRSTILAVDNLNGAKVLGRLLRVDHVLTYKLPKNLEKLDADRKKLMLEGCAPKPIEMPQQEEIVSEGSSNDEEKKDKKKKKKKEKKKKKKHRKDSSASEDNVNSVESTQRWERSEKDRDKQRHKKHDSPDHKDRKSGWNQDKMPHHQDRDRQGHSRGEGHKSDHGRLKPDIKRNSPERQRRTRSRSRDRQRDRFRSDSRDRNRHQR